MFNKCFPLLAAIAMQSSTSAGAATVGLTFDPTRCDNYQGLTAMRTGTEADGDLFRIVRTGAKKADTAWCALSERVLLPADAAFAVVDFDIYTDADWRPVCWDSPNSRTRVCWYDAKGGKVKVSMWADQLDGLHEAEQLDLLFKPGVYSHFRIVRAVPAGAASFALAFARDSPNVEPGERVSVRGATVAWIKKGEACPVEVSPDLEGPEVTIAFTSPTLDARVAVRYIVRDSSGVDFASLKVTDAAGKVNYPFVRGGDVITVRPGFAWPEGDNHLRISVRDLAGNETRIAKAFRIGTKPNVPGTRLRADGVLLAGGKPVFPVGFFGLCAREANLYSLARCFDDVAAVGVNLAHSYSHFMDKAFADGCARTGMISFQRAYTAAEGLPWFEKKARQDPTIGLWYVGDDTCLHFPPAEVANRVEALQALDGTRLTCHADVYTARFGRYADLVDVFMPEIYPLHADRDVTNCVARTIDIMENCQAEIRAHSHGRPRAVWPIIQYFRGWTSWHHMPTPSEVRAMSFAAIVHGAKGITWYTYGGFVDPDKKRINLGVCSSAETLRTATGLTRSISALAPFLYAEAVAQPAAPTVISGPKVDGCGRPAITMILKRANGRDLAIAVNATLQPVRARLATGKKSDGAIAVKYENRSLVTAKGSIEDDFAPFAVHIYEWDSDR